MWRSILLLCLGLAGCNFTILGAYDNAAPGVGGNGEVLDGGVAEPPDLEPTMTPPPTATPDLAAPGDLALNPCGSSGPAIAGSAGAQCAAGSKLKIDGALDDWSDVTFVALTHANAAFSKGTWNGTAAVDDTNSSGSFAVQWDGDYLYVAARVNDDVRGVFPASPNPAQDDGVEIFIDGNHDRADGAYNTDDHGLVITADGRSQDAQYGQQPHALPSGVKFAVANGASAGYTVEVAIPWQVLGSAAAQGGRALGFDFAISDDDGTSFQIQSHLLIWKFVMPTSGCTTSPTCNTKIFGDLQLLGR